MKTELSISAMFFSSFLAGISTDCEIRSFVAMNYAIFKLCDALRCPKLAALECARPNKVGRRLNAETVSLIDRKALASTR
jgi:hypothetical protein